MQIFTELNKNHNLSLALGFFDGVHLGHKKVIESAVNFAKKNNTKSAVITFQDHPYCYLNGVCPKYILIQDDRRKYIEKLGVDYLYELDFESFSGLTAQDYLKNIIIDYFMPISISTGWNHNFGYKKSGNVVFLRLNSKKYGYEFFEIQPEKFGNEIISSTKIRKMLTCGNIKKVNKMLGYQYSVSGKVVEGNKIGRTIGFKTANINYPLELIEIPYGVYKVNLIYNDKTYKGISNFGIRPTIGGNYAILETHILDFDEEIYGKKITVEFLDMIRKEKKFSSLEDLKSQIETDILRNFNG